ncbi:MAG TPA: hypothetical protein DEO38_03010 [Bacteroidales bacterium]|jgi:hypothetical protein|nr:hypothetical protein [Bacteroidales bacterium]
MSDWQEKYDSYWIGIVIGLLIPGLFAWAYIERMNLWYALQTLQFAQGTVLNKLLLVSVFPNLAFIFVFYQIDMWRLSKGLLIGAMPYMLASLFLSM